jgi:hypothetical protein
MGVRGGDTTWTAPRVRARVLGRGLREDARFDMSTRRNEPHTQPSGAVPKVFSTSAKSEADCDCSYLHFVRVAYLMATA